MHVEPSANNVRTIDETVARENELFYVNRRKQQFISKIGKDHNNNQRHNLYTSTRRWISISWNYLCEKCQSQEWRRGDVMEPAHLIARRAQTASANWVTSRCERNRKTKSQHKHDGVSVHFITLFITNWRCPVRNWRALVIYLNFIRFDIK